MRIGFIGFGEAAYNISLGLKKEGINDICANDKMAQHSVMGEQVQNRAKDAGVSLLSSASEVVGSSDIIFAAVPSSFTMSVCDEILGDLRPGQLYIDVSASTPQIKKDIWEKIKHTEVLFVDAAMLGSLPKDKHKVPITASGNGALKFKEIMSDYGMNITVADDEPGSASAIKLVRSIYMKGISALMLETMQAAEAYGVSEQIIKSLGKSMDGISFSNHLDRLVTGSAVHSIRRAAELKGSLQMLHQAGVDSNMTEATKKTLESLEQYNFAVRFANNSPHSWKEIVAITQQKES